MRERAEQGAELEEAHTTASERSSEQHGGEDASEVRRGPAPTNEPVDAPPGNPFALLMSLVWKLPRWSRVPICALILIPLGWAVIPAALQATIINIVAPQHLGTALFPSVEHELAEYNIAITPAGGANWDLNFKFRKLRGDVTRLGDAIATSDALTKVRSATHEVYFGKDKINPQKQVNLSRYVVSLDISKDKPDELLSANIHYEVAGGFTGVHTEWAGVLSLQPTRKAIVHIVFQPQKVGRNFRFSEYEWSVSPNEAQTLDRQNYRYDPATNTLNWTIDFPRLNYVYRVDWDW